MGEGPGRTRETGRGSGAGGPRVVELSPEQLARLLAEGGVRLLDVRQSLEHWLERIPGSELAPLSAFDPARYAAEAGATVLYCRSGARSHAAASRLSAASGQPVRHLAGGINAWKSSGRPIERWGRTRKDEG